MQMISSDQLNIKHALSVAAGRRRRRTVWPYKINVLQRNVCESISACKHSSKIKLTPMYICLSLAHEVRNQPQDSESESAEGLQLGPR